MNDSPALLFHPDAFSPASGRTMGRTVAGQSFLKAFVNSHSGPVVGLGIDNASESAFRLAIAGVNAKAQAAWIPPSHTHRLKEVGAALVPGPGLGQFAEIRRRHGADAWSLIGVTYTISSDRVITSIVEMMSRPVMPWDAVICTCKATRDTLNHVLDEEWAHLTERLGASRRPEFLRPVLPLGIHCSDFDFDAERRALARQRLGVAEDEVVAIFTGRLSFHAKAHPLPMYLGLETAARQSGRKVVLVQSSWFPNEHVAHAYQDGARRFCPSVRPLWSDGGNDEARRDVWAAADIFISLSDNYQESFGLTPIEAMAAGLPVVVTDWNGYRDTVRDGVDGFRIKTFAPGPSYGPVIASDYETASLGFDQYSGATSLATSVDLPELADRLTDLVSNPELRQKMGEAGRQRARDYDWSVVLESYRALWAECRAIRLASRESVRSDPSVQLVRDPFAMFATYPSRHIDERSRLGPGPIAAHFPDVRQHPLFGHVRVCLPSVSPLLELVYAATTVQQNPSELAAIGAALNLPIDRVVLAAAILAKMGAVAVLPLDAQTA